MVVEVGEAKEALESSWLWEVKVGQSFPFWKLRMIGSLLKYAVKAGCI